MEGLKPLCFAQIHPHVGDCDCMVQTEARRPRARPPKQGSASDECRSTTGRSALRTVSSTQAALSPDSPSRRSTARTPIGVTEGRHCLRPVTSAATVPASPTRPVRTPLNTNTLSSSGTNLAQACTLASGGAPDSADVRPQGREAVQPFQHTGRWDSPFESRPATEAGNCLDLGPHAGLHPVPLVRIVPVLPSPTWTLAVVDALYHLEEHGSYAEPGFMEPEGVVVYTRGRRQAVRVLRSMIGTREAEVIYTYNAQNVRELVLEASNAVLRYGGSCCYTGP